MAAEIIQDFGPEHALQEVDRLIDDVESSIGVLNTSQGPVPRDQNLAKILRALRILRQQVGKALETPQQDSEEVDFSIYGGDAGEGPFVDNEGREL
ncbi:hypothetical protein [Microbacterium galbinum]|uniref:Uncharacterized protein n=1 Tax=Microbacterium galbinum TaxID=2851646 RepID=A0ABY4IN84_9MICO|nr:hypothetical protein [Microbacterium galbinum]UPL13043.1 hypothetical protein KV396_00400 [Microbacterium galbinum]